MKAQMEEVEDDLAAEEENKLINEVRSARLPTSWLLTLDLRSTKHGAFNYISRYLTVGQLRISNAGRKMHHIFMTWSLPMLSIGQV